MSQGSSEQRLVLLDPTSRGPILIATISASRSFCFLFKRKKCQSVENTNMLFLGVL